MCRCLYLQRLCPLPGFSYFSVFGTFLGVKLWAVVCSPQPITASRVWAWEEELIVWQYKKFVYVLRLSVLWSPRNRQVSKLDHPHRIVDVKFAFSLNRPLWLPGEYKRQAFITAKIHIYTTIHLLIGRLLHILCVRPILHLTSRTGASWGFSTFLSISTQSYLHFISQS